MQLVVASSSGHLPSLCRVSLGFYRNTVPYVLEELLVVLGDVPSFLSHPFSTLHYGRSVVTARVVGTTELQRVQSSTLDEWNGTEIGHAIGIFHLEWSDQSKRLGSLKELYLRVELFVRFFSPMTDAQMHRFIDFLCQGPALVKQSSTVWGRQSTSRLRPTYTDSLERHSGSSSLLEVETRRLFYS